MNLIDTFKIGYYISKLGDDFRELTWHKSRQLFTATGIIGIPVGEKLKYHKTLKSDKSAYKALEKLYNVLHE
jgi:hypothetical protein